MIIEKERIIRRKMRTEVLPEKKKRSGLIYLDIEGFLEREKMRRTKERK
jgi:hypothetical protein